MSVPIRSRAFLPAHIIAATFLLLFACQPAMDADRSSSRADILALIRARGEAAIMVALVEPAGYGRADADAARIRADIARMQAEVLAALDTADYRDRVRYAAIPAMAGTVRTERGLSVLLAHPHVRRVDLDTGGTGTRR